MFTSFLVMLVNRWGPWRRTGGLAGSHHVRDATEDVGSGAKTHDRRPDNGAAVEELAVRQGRGAVPPPGSFLSVHDKPNRRAGRGSWMNEACTVWLRRLIEVENEKAARTCASRPGEGR